MNIDKLQSPRGRTEELEAMEDQHLVEEFEAAEARGQITWLSDEEMGAFLDRLASEAHGRA